MVVAQAYAMAVSMPRTRAADHFALTASMRQTPATTWAVASRSARQRRRENFYFAVLTKPFMEVMVLKTKEILQTVGTMVLVGAASTAGAALWTTVLERKFLLARAKLTQPKSDKIIFVDFRKKKRGIWAAKQRLSLFRTNGTAYYGDKYYER